MKPTRPCLALSLILLAGSLPGQAVAEPPRSEDIRRLREKIDGLLRAELTGRWYPRSLDRELGGFHQSFARDWSPLPDENRFLVYQARMTWTAAAFAAYSPPHRDEYVRYARQGIEYLDRVMRDREFGGFHWVLDPRGQVDPRLGDEKHVYGTAFVLYAASEVYEVTHDDLALKVARDAFDWLEDHAHDGEHGGYFEAITPRGEADPGLGRGRPAREADRPARHLLRLQVDELPHPSPGGDRRVLQGREDSPGHAAARGRSTPSSGTGSPPSRAR